MGMVKAAFRGKFLALKTYVREEEYLNYVT